MSQTLHWLCLAAVLVAAGWDLKRREVPDLVPAILAGASVVAAAFGRHPVGWGGLLLGGAIGFGLGALLFRLGGLGGGDVKLVGAVGAAVGLEGLLGTLFWMALFGGVLSVVAWLRGKDELAYCPAIAAGYAVYGMTTGAFSAVA